MLYVLVAVFWYATGEISVDSEWFNTMKECDAASQSYAEQLAGTANLRAFRMTCVPFSDPGHEEKA